jgi:leucyl-tRNA synthetase
MGDKGIDLYIGGVEHAVLHLLYARFWHKILYDLRIVTTKEPFYKLFNQGYIEAYAYKNKKGFYVNANDVKEVAPKKFEYKGEPVIQEYGKMGKSLKNIVTPDDVIDEYGADTFRLYEMSMGPLDVSRPWETRSIIGLYRFLSRLWRNIFDVDNKLLRKLDNNISDEQAKILNIAIDSTTTEMDNMRFNTAISHLIVLNNAMTKIVTSGDSLSSELVKNMLIMLHPLAPHFTAECWNILGFEKDSDIVFTKYPTANKKFLKKDIQTCVIQINGKIKAKIDIDPSLEKSEIEKIALKNEKVKQELSEKTIKKIIVVPPKIVSIVI